MTIQLQGKRALVCGASQGIGEACARQLAKAGARVLVVARNEEKLQKVVRELTQLSQEFAGACGSQPQLQSQLHSSAMAESQSQPQHDYLSVDLSDLQAVRSVLPEKIKAFGGGFEILICNSGGPKGGPLLEAQFEEFVKAFEMHVLVNTYLVQSCLPAMKASLYGRVINIISTSVKTPIPGLGVSNTIRGAVANWAKTLSVEIAEHGVTVNNILPGFTKTERFRNLSKAASQKRGVSESEIEKGWLAQIPAARFGEAVDVANAALFLASPLASYVNGINLPVDGGRTPSL
jgi:3-oxoacyl-[acyl-carrier protein] reductase